jgi:hypothetical protein
MAVLELVRDSYTPVPHWLPRTYLAVLMLATANMLTGTRSQVDRLFVQKTQAAWESLWPSLLSEMPRPLRDGEMGAVYVGHDGSQPTILRLFDISDGGLEILVKLLPCTCSGPWTAFVTNLKSGRVFATVSPE